MNKTVKCDLNVVVNQVGELTNATLKFGPVVLGQGNLFGKWSEEDVIREIRRNGAIRFTLNETGVAVLRAQGIKL